MTGQDGRLAMKTNSRPGRSGASFESLEQAETVAGQLLAAVPGVVAIIVTMEHVLLGARD